MQTITTSNNNNSFVRGFSTKKRSKLKRLFVCLLVFFVFFLCIMGLRKPRHHFFIEDSFLSACGLSSAR